MLADESFLCCWESALLKGAHRPRAFFWWGARRREVSGTSGMPHGRTRGSFCIVFECKERVYSRQPNKK